MKSQVYAYLQEHADRALEDLIEFASIPSVSTDPAYANSMSLAAQWVAERLERSGMEAVRVVPTDRHPVVVGEWLNTSDAPTILVYGHYDVQPPDPVERWTHDPFAPEVRNGRVYARGVSDDKGPMLIPLLVAEAFMATDGRLPINVKFLFEGEEEIGSPSLEPFISENAERLRANFALSADGAMWRIDEPSVTVASRGLAGMEFTVRGAAKDLHSGRHGGAVANPLHALAAMVAGLHGADGRVTVEGFYDDVVELTADERAELAALPFDDENYMREIGAPALFGEQGYSTPERLWARPTLEINGMGGGYQGAGSKTVIPCDAKAKITCRLVANQRPDDILSKVTQHLQAHTPPGVTVSIAMEGHNALPYQIPSDHVGLHVAEQVLEQIYSNAPLKVRMGGTLPVSELFLRLLGIYTVFFSFSTADEDFHAPNEFFRINRLHEGLAAWALYWERLGAA